MQDGEIWTFSVRAFDSPRPERTITVNYEGFAEGLITAFLKLPLLVCPVACLYTCMISLNFQLNYY